MSKLTAWQAVMLNIAAEELPSESDITGADDIELQEIAEKASGKRRRDRYRGFIRTWALWTQGRTVTPSFMRSFRSG